MRIYSVLILILLLAVSLNAQDSSQVKSVQHGPHFIDKDGDGYNDNAPDHDGDGIPNGLDEDYQGHKYRGQKEHFIDLDGDGINDAIESAENSKKGMGTKARKGQKGNPLNDNATPQKGMQKRKGRK